MANLFMKREEPVRVVFDLETLDTNPTSVVLSLGMTTFQITQPDSFADLVNRGVNMVFEVDVQKAKGLTTSQDTIDWWANQGPEAQAAVMGGTDNPADLHKMITQTFGKPLMSDRWYCRGPHFDAAIITNFCQAFELKTPWKYSKVRDTRTWFDFYPEFEFRDKEPEGFIYHNSLHDSALEAYNMQTCYRQFHVKEAA